MDPASVTVILAAAILLALGVVMSTVLGVANKVFHVPVDLRVERVIEALPGANCGGCNYVGCSEYAEAVVYKGEAVDKCTVGGAAVAAELAAIMGVELRESWPVRPIVHCGATTEQRLQRAPYDGEQTCHAANLVSGVQGCVYGCLGLGDCVRACDYDAIHIEDGVAVVDYLECIGCGACAKACPRNIISMVPFKADRILAVRCANRDFGKEVMAVCTVGCTGCKACMRADPVLISMDGHLPVLDYGKYDPAVNLQVIPEKCKRGSMVWIGKPTAKDLAEAVGELPHIQQADFKTTVDETEWRG
jgi:electron transport complex protein RnfB